MNAKTEGLATSATADHSKPGLPWLVADVGGTNARFGWVSEAGGCVQQVRTIAVAAHSGLAQAAADYLARLGAVDRPRRAAIAVATAVGPERVEFTNSPWSFSRRNLQAALGVETLLVLNDFEALALSLPRLRPDQLRSADALPRRQGTLAVVGPGTGLGVGAVVQTAHGWVALPGEGGHATLAAADEHEEAVLRHARRRHAHVSGERLLSGIGLPLLHEAVLAVDGRAAASLGAPEVVEGAVAGNTDCRRTMDIFCALLGGMAGNVALTVGARDGVFIGGGIVPRLGELFFASRFRERFEAKGRFSSYLKAVPTAVITDTLAALTGTALALEQLAAR